MYQEENLCFCKYCGNEVAENTKFYTKCGKPIVNEAVQNKVHTFEPNEIIQSKNKKPYVIIGVLAIIVCLLVGGEFGYSKISSQDIDRGYTRESTVSDVKRAEMLKLDSSFKPKVNYMNDQTEVFNEDKQIYEYRLTGEKTDKVYSLYYKNAKIKGVKASKGMVIKFNLETGCASSVHYGLTDKEFDKFLSKMGEPDYNDSDGIRWNSSKHGWIVAMYCNNFSEEVFHGSGYEISYYY